MSFNKTNRKITTVPYKVLDAPSLQDDFYLNLLDWSHNNMLAVGLSSTVYLWEANTSAVTKLCDLGLQDHVTAVHWAKRNNHLSLGTFSGDVQIWDSVKLKKIRTLKGHTSRVGSLAWSSSLICSGSRDKTILMRDLRLQDPIVQTLVGHKQEVCGLKWSFDEQKLASGGNDNQLLIWSAR